MATVFEELPADSIAGLPLHTATDPTWSQVAARDLPALLEDHAHCEMKAAATGFRLMGSYPAQRPLVEAMLILVREEMRHFERVRDMLDARGRELAKPEPDRYVGRLRKETHMGATPDRGLVDRLLICALVEARSCERFRLLAREQMVPLELRRFYAELALAENRHHEVFVNLARDLDQEWADQRLTEMSRIESEIIASLPHRATIH